MPKTPLPYDALGVLMALTAAGPAAMALLPENLRPRVTHSVAWALMGAFLLDAVLAFVGTGYLLWASLSTGYWCDSVLLVLILIPTVFLFVPYLWFVIYYICEPVPPGGQPSRIQRLREWWGKRGG